jgi:hypothetical protein
MVKNQTDRKLKSLRSGNRGEYKCDEFVQFCRERGIRREFTAPHSPEQSGVAEWMNRTIQEWIVSMLHHSGLSDGFWAEPLLTAVHIINMSPSRPLGYGPDGSFGYRLWDPETHQVVRSSDVVFNEFAMHKSTECPIEVRRVTFSNVTAPLDGPAQHTRSATRLTDPLDTEGAISEDHPSSSATIGPAGSDVNCSNVRSTIAPEPASPVVPRRSERLSQPPERFSPGLFFTDAGEPMTYREAIQATDAASWRLAME